MGIYWPLKEGKAVAHGNICVNLDESTKTDDYILKTLTFWDRSGVIVGFISLLTK